MERASRLTEQQIATLETEFSDQICGPARARQNRDRDRILAKSLCESIHQSGRFSWIGLFQIGSSRHLVLSLEQISHHAASESLENGLISAQLAALTQELPEDYSVDLHIFNAELTGRLQADDARADIKKHDIAKGKGTVRLRWQAFIPSNGPERPDLPIEFIRVESHHIEEEHDTMCRYCGHKTQKAYMTRERWAKKKILVGENLPGYRCGHCGNETLLPEASVEFLTEAIAIIAPTGDSLSISILKNELIAAQAALAATHSNKSQ